MADQSYWQRAGVGRTVTRRRALGVGGAGAIAAFLAACGGNNNKGGSATKAPTSAATAATAAGTAAAAASVAAAGTPAATATFAPNAPAAANTVVGAATAAGETPVRGGTLRTGTFLSVLGIDPHIEVSIGLVWDEKLYSYLGAYANVEQKFHPLSTQSLEQPSHTEFVFKLRQDVKFHNLDPVNGRTQDANDALYSLQRFRDLPQAQNNDFFKSVVAKMEVIDPFTFKVTTKAPYAEALNELGGVQEAIVPHEAVEKFGDLTANAIGAGPFMLDKYTKGETTVLKRNPDYFDKTLPYLDGYTCTTILDTGTLIQAYKNDQIDINGAILTKLDYDDLVKNPKLVNQKIPSLGYGSLGLNASMKPFDDPRVRKALWLGVDRQQFIDKIGQGDGEPMAVIDGGLTFWVLSQEELKPYIGYDLQQAKQLLSAAGYDNGFDMTIETSGSLQIYTDYADVLVSELKKLGINPKVNLSDLPTYLNNHLFKGDFMSTSFTGNPYETPKIPLGFYHKNGLGNGSWWHYDNEAVSAAIDAENMELDINKRQQLVKQVQKMILDDAAPYINWITPVAYNSWNQRVGGYDPSLRGWQGFRYSEFLKPGL